jgi:hypothetical protein
VLFTPNPRLKGLQKTCGNADCKKKWNRFCQRRWKRQNRDTCRESQKDWCAAHPGYWKTYRQGHPDYVKRNRIQTVARKKKVRWRGLQRKLDILEVIDNTMEYWNMPWFAKETRSLIPMLFAYTSRHGNTPTARHGQSPPP